MIVIRLEIINHNIHTVYYEKINMLRNFKIINYYHLDILIKYY